MCTGAREPVCDNFVCITNTDNKSLGRVTVSIEVKSAKKGVGSDHAKIFCGFDIVYIGQHRVTMDAQK